MQRIVIRNNGPVVNFEMDVTDVNLLIGEQATGKSTVAKSIYFFRNAKTLLSNYFFQIAEYGTYGEWADDQVPFYKKLSQEMKDVFIRLFGYSWDLSPGFEMRYDFADGIWMEVLLRDSERSERKYISVMYSPELTRQLVNLEHQVRAFFTDGSVPGGSLALEQETRLRNRSFIVNQINLIFADEYATYYIPAGRSLLTVLSASRAAMNLTTNLDFITERFMSLIDTVRGSFKAGVRDAYMYYPRGARTVDVHALAEKVISMQKGEYYSAQGGEELHIAGDGDGSVIKLNFMSSGQQELLWLINFLYVLMLKQEKAFVIIEEPEAHVYPTLQKEIAEFIALYVNSCSGQVLCTTHSPYILSAFNNLYYAGSVCALGSPYAEMAKKIVPPMSIIRKGALNAIKLMGGGAQGAYESLVNAEDGEMNSYMLDEVSDVINETYTGLYNIWLDAEQ